MSRSRRILLAHNFYQQSGGEDRVFHAEADMLRRRGHQVFLYEEHNDRIRHQGALKTAFQTIWSSHSYDRLRETIRENQVELCHFHNTFPLISPSAYYVSQQLQVPVIQTLHNYRLICPGSLLMRDGRICEDCVGRKIVWPGAANKCYRGSYSASAVSATAFSIHNLLGTWAKQVDRYIVLTEFARWKFIQGGLPVDKIAVKGNFIDPDPGAGNGEGGHALFVGRLSPEKGVVTLLDAWNRGALPMPLRIAGGGPLADLVKETALGNPNVQWLGEIGRDRVLEEMQSARVLICPSTWYEGFPLIIVEAFAAGLPVIASDLGSMPELIEPGRTGLLFQAGNPEELSLKVQWAFEHPGRVREMRANARKAYEARYTAEKNYLSLISIYDEVLAPRRNRAEVREHEVVLQ